MQGGSARSGGGWSGIAGGILAAGLAFAPAPAGAFAVFGRVCSPSLHPCGSPENPLDVRATLEAAPRWSAAAVGGRGLQGGIQVGVAPGLADAFGFSGPAEGARFEALVRAAFAAWESPVLSFDVAFSAPGVVLDGGAAGYEIDVHAVPSSDPLFGSVGLFGVAYYDAVYDPGRRLTNGAILAGDAIRGADILLAPDRVDALSRLLGLGPDGRADFVQRVLTHEIGHTLGLDHPNVDPGVNLDDDGDPLTRVAVDPADPFARLRVSPNVDRDALMSNAPLGYEAGFFTALRADDLSGRDVLYPVPVPEPASALLLGASCAALGALRRGLPERRLPSARCRGCPSTCARAPCARPRSTRSATSTTWPGWSA